MTPAELLALLNGDYENAMISMTPGGIEEQEAQGQSSLVENEMLPVEGDWKALTAMGIVPVDDPATANGFFVRATLPQGWKKVATDHSLWSELLDETGRRRASIFYKAAFYDQRAFIRVESE